MRRIERKDHFMIEVRDVVKTFEGFRALDGLSINVPKGSVYGLVGPNGAGKSTIIRHLTGAYRPDSGEVLYEGKPIYENEQIKARIACIPDDIFYFSQNSTLDMMKFLKGMYPSFDTGRYSKLKGAFQLDERTPMRRLSKGMQKQAAFWLSLCQRPDVMILDEPVDGLDPVMRRQVWGLIMGDVMENGTTVLISSHNLRELEDVCDHVGIIHKGRIMLERTLSELQDNIVKIQVVFPDEDTEVPDSFDILHKSRTGRIVTLIVRGRTEEISAQTAAMNPLFFDLLPLTLEEIFIYELGGADYAVKDIIF